MQEMTNCAWFSFLPQPVSAKHSFIHIAVSEMIYFKRVKETTILFYAETIADL